MNSSHIGKPSRGAVRSCLSSLFSLPAVFCVLLFGLSAWAQVPSGPSDVVNELHHKLMEVMRHSAPQDYAGRYRTLAPVISTHFDTPLIAKVILSRYWAKLSEEQKTEFIKLFNQLSIATYASRFDAYNGEKFVELSREELKRGRLLVKTELQRVGKEPVKLDYLMHQRDGTWYIISVIANGVNDLSLKRAEYAAVIKDKGYAALLEDMTAKIRTMEAAANG